MIAINKLRAIKIYGQSCSIGFLYVYDISAYNEKYKYIYLEQQLAESDTNRVRAIMNICQQENMPYTGVLTVVSVSNEYNLDKTGNRIFISSDEYSPEELLERLGYNV